MMSNVCRIGFSVLTGLGLLLSLSCSAIDNSRLARERAGGALTMNYDSANPTLAFAAREIETLLGPVARGGGEPWRVELVIDPAMAPYSFGVACTRARRAAPLDIRLTGPDARGVLDAAYTMMERAGIRFEVTGPVVPAKVDLDKLAGWSETFRPAIEQRGIRQHINFPMDISSYSLDEALEYLRNVSRMRSNHVTFHSYPNQWYAVKFPSGSKELKAGAFFYGMRFDVPEAPLLKGLVGNRKTYCIPEFEYAYDMPDEISVKAREWLRALMAESKRMGMHLQLSFELREQRMEDSLATVDAILADYPMIDTLELITQENGAWNTAPATAAEIKKSIVDGFGAEALNLPGLAPLITDEVVSEIDMIRELGHNIQVVNELKKKWAGQPRPDLMISAYVTPSNYLAKAVLLMRRYVPADVKMGFLPAHGARQVADAIEKLKLTPEDWRRTMVYSWAEFDGNMFVQQSEVDGLRRLIALAQKENGGRAMTGLAINHWRNSENRTTLRYAAQAGLRGPVEREAFFEEYARALELGRPARFVESMRALDELETWMRENLINVGFPLIAMWVGSGTDWMARWEPAHVQRAIAQFEEVREGLRASARATRNEESKRYLALLINRVDCSILHLRCVARLQELHAILKAKDPARLTEEQRRQVREACAQAQPLAEQYLALYGSMRADRGTEGQLLAYYYCVPAMIKRLAHDYGGATEEKIDSKAGSDAPPVPLKPD